MLLTTAFSRLSLPLPSLKTAEDLNRERSESNSLSLTPSPKANCLSPAVISGCRASSREKSPNRRKYSSPHSGKVLEIDSDDIRRIRDLWTKTDKTTAMQQVFLTFFEYGQLDIAKYFGLANLTREQLKNSHKLNAHVSKFVYFFTALIDHLTKGDHDQFVELVRAVGRRHVNIKGMSFTAEKWLGLKNIMLNCLCNDDNNGNSKTRQAWNKLMTFVISEMKDAYLDRVRSNSWPRTGDEDSGSTDSDESLSGQCPGGRNASSLEENEIVGRLEL